MLKYKFCNILAHASLELYSMILKGRRGRRGSCRRNRHGGSRVHTKETKVTTPTDSLYGRSSILFLHPESPTRITPPSTRVCWPLSSSSRQNASINFSHSLAHTLDLCNSYSNSFQNTFGNLQFCCFICFTYSRIA